MALKFLEVGRKEICSAQYVYPQCSWKTVLRILGVGVKCLGRGPENCVKGVKLQQCFQLSWKRHMAAVQMWKGRVGALILLGWSHNEPRTGMYVKSLVWSSLSGKPASEHCLDLPAPSGERLESEGPRLSECFSTGDVCTIEACQALNRIRGSSLKQEDLRELCCG